MNGRRDNGMTRLLAEGSSRRTGRAKGALKGHTSIGRHYGHTTGSNARTNHRGQAGRQRHGNVRRELTRTRSTGKSKLNSVLLRLNILNLGMRHRANASLTTTDRRGSKRRMVSTLNDTIKVIRRDISQHRHLVRTSKRRQRRTYQRSVTTRSTRLLRSGNRSTGSHNHRPDTGQLSSGRRDGNTSSRRRRQKRRHVRHIKRSLTGLALRPNRGHADSRDHSRTTHYKIMLHVNRQRRGNDNEVDHTEHGRKRNAINSARRTNSTTRHDKTTGLAYHIVTRRSKRVNGRNPTRKAGTLMPPLTYGHTYHQSIGSITSAISRTDHGSTKGRNSRSVKGLLRRNLGQLKLMLNLLHNLIYNHDISRTLIDGTFHGTNRLKRLLRRLVRLTQARRSLRHIILSRTRRTIRYLGALHISITHIFSNRTRTHRTHHIYRRIIFATRGIRRLLDRLFIHRGSSLC